MANSVTVKHLSASTNGRQILIVQTAIATGDTVHTAVNTAGKKDRVYLSATNTSVTPVLLTVGLGGVVDPTDLIKVTIPAQGGLWPILDGSFISGGLVIKASAATGSVVNVSGHVFEVTD